MGLRFVLTRPRDRGTDLARRLGDAGHEVFSVPLTRIEDAAAFPDPAGFDGVLFTSAAAAERAPGHAAWPRVGAVGPATASALADRGIPVEVVGAGGGAELAAAWGAAAGQRLLLPQAEEAHGALADGLRAAGAEVVAVAVYRTVPEEVEPAGRDLLESADVICFFAPSAVRAYRDLGLAGSGRMWAHGPTTRAALERLLPSERHLDALDDLL